MQSAHQDLVTLLCRQVTHIDGKHEYFVQSCITYEQGETLRMIFKFSRFIGCITFALSSHLFIHRSLLICFPSAIYASVSNFLFCNVQYMHMSAKFCWCLYIGLLSEGPRYPPENISVFLRNTWRVSPGVGSLDDQVISVSTCIFLPVKKRSEFWCLARQGCYDISDWRII